MIRKIVIGYKNLLSGALGIVALLALCSLFGAAIVFPLWKLATSFPTAYSALACTLIAAAVVFMVARSAKAHGARAFAKSALKFAVAAMGLSLCVALVLMGKRILAIPALVAALFAYGLVSFQK